MAAYRRATSFLTPMTAFRSQAPCSKAAGNGPLLLISSATAVPRGFYASFATAAVQAGARAALIYDYRGSGGSVRPKGWRKRIGMKDWAVLDLPAAARALDKVGPAILWSAWPILRWPGARTLRHF
jgi:predicted alpha/beta hydrolase